MTALLSRLARELFRREMLSARSRWWCVAEGMSQWMVLLRNELAPHVGGRAASAEILTELAGAMLHRRYDALRSAYPHLPDPTLDPRAVGLVMGALGRVATHVESAWAFDGVRGAPRSFFEHARAEELIAPIAIEARWEEVTNHLGELLVALTEGLPSRMHRAPPILGDICFQAGVRCARKMKRAFALDHSVESAIEVLRMSEYVFRVNPDHWGTADEATKRGFIEGTACPWYTAPGWTGTHCGIFGQFQSGIGSVFGLRYHLTSTIPRHGGHTCRIDLKPAEPLIQLRAGAPLRPAASTSSASRATP